MKHLLTILLLVSSIIQVQAQVEREIAGDILSNEAPSVRFEQYGLEHGMAQLSVHRIMQDSKGYIWFGTQGGLHRFDGYEFKVFTTIPFDTTSLSSSWVWSMTEAKDGYLWVSTYGGGLSKLDPNTGKSIHFLPDPEDPSSISNEVSTSTFETSNGDLWIATMNGLNRMTADEEGVFKHYYHDPNDNTTITDNRLFTINGDEEGYLWIGSINGVSRLDLTTEKVRRYLYEPEVNAIYNHPQNVIQSYIMPGDRDHIWLASGNGLVKLEIESGEYKRYLVVPNGGGQVDKTNYLQTISPDPNDANILWVGGSSTGIARFDIRQETFTVYNHDPSDPNSISENEVFSLFLDNSGMMWAGTGTTGLNVFNPGAVNFTHIKPSVGDPNGLAPGPVWGIYEDKFGDLWVGSLSEEFGETLTRFSATSGKVTKYRHNSNDPNTLHGRNYWAFAEDGAGRFWVGGLGGLSMLDRKTGKATRFIRPRTPGRSRNSIVSMVVDKLDPSVIWLGSRAGVDRFDTETGEFTSIDLPTFGQATQPLIFSLTQTPDGILWIGSTSGLMSMDQEGVITLASAYDPSDRTGISDFVIQSIMERQNEPGILWLGMSNEGGLNRFDTKTGITRHYRTEDGLANNNIYGILEDDTGNLWISTNAGISEFNPVTEEFRNYDLDDGLIALEYDQNAYEKGRDGTLYFGSPQGVTAFNPATLRTNETPPLVEISDFKIANKSVIPGPESPLDQHISETREVTVGHDQNELTIDYVGFHFADPQKNQYAYQLEGFDTDWIDAGSQRSANYTNLPPGSYTFKVKAANSDGVWNENGDSLKLVVLPPWFRTWWAYMLFAVSLVLGVLFVDRFQRHRLSKKEQEKAALREAELRAEAENKRRADTENLSAIGKAIISSLSVDRIIETVYENVNALMDATIFGVGIYNDENQTLEFPATKEKGVMLPPYSNHLDEEHWLSVVCFKEKREVVISDFHEEYIKYIPSYQQPLAGESPESLIYMPLTQKEKVIGVITTQSFTKDAYTDYHINLLRNLANYAAIALDNASAYRKLNSTQEQLVHAEKMASLGELTAGIAHEIQNPLNFVNNFSEVNKELVEELLDELKKGNLKEAQEIGNDLIENENKITHHGKRAEQIVKSMLQHSRGSAGQKEPTDINGLCDEYVRLAYHGMRAKDKSFNVELNVKLDPKAGVVDVVPQDIGRVLLNIITNSFHALSDKIGNSSNGFHPELGLSTKRRKGQLEIRISDNGEGIPADIQKKVFEPFFSTKSTGKGTGLGLSLSYEIITKGHRGTIEFKSKDGDGTEFIIQLPLTN